MGLEQKTLPPSPFLLSLTPLFPPLTQKKHHSQVQDDYLDAFGDPASIGKVGTDIQDNKCSWLVCTALATASPAQRAVIEKNYGKDDEGAVAAVKAVYAELDLEGKFKAYEAASYAALSADIAGQGDVPPGVFTAMLAKIYKRSK
jgi:farnesyl diphosphate synthase